jgi:hypothetical protein
MHTKTAESNLSERDWKLGLGRSRKTTDGGGHFQMSQKFKRRNSMCGQLSLRLLNYVRKVTDATIEQRRQPHTLTTD